MGGAAIREGARSGTPPSASAALRACSLGALRPQPPALVQAARWPFCSA